MASAGRTYQNHQAVKKIIKIATEHPELSSREIGKLAGRDQSCVTRALKRYGIKKKDLGDYITNRGNLLAGTQDKILHSISMQDLDKASLRDKGLVYGILFDKERLEKNQSTSNIQLAAIVAEVDKLEREKPE